MHAPETPIAVLIRDLQGCVPISKVIREGDDVVLLTPVVVPPVQGTTHAADGSNTKDPFEDFGRALLGHSPRPKIHHVPYTKRSGISETHLDIIRNNDAKLVIFVISGPPLPGQASQVKMAEYLRTGAGDRPLVIVACFNMRELDGLGTSFPTVVQTSGYSPSALHHVTNLIFKGEHNGSSATLQNLVLAPKTWEVAVTNNLLDLRPHEEAIHDLWCQTWGRDMSPSRYELQSLLIRDGYAKHYTVREPETGVLVGFCATYTTYANQGGERLVGSLAMIIVKPEHRGRGIGRSLHDVAIKQLSRTRGVFRLQLGSTFPRLLYGLPVDSASEGWFRRRGWDFDQSSPGKGQEVSDWHLDFNDYPTRQYPSASGLVFGPCELSEFPAVLNLVASESAHNNQMGWYDQYTQLNNPFLVRDIIMGVVGRQVVASAITYLPKSENPVASDIPWAGLISNATGGVACICISDTSILVSRDEAMLGLLDACVKRLKEQGMQGMLLDAVMGGDEGFYAMGFQKRNSYREVWRSVPDER
ncbi:hypothetical protein MCOR27_008406 [Pyricularia oryzae]|uniref:N-acetyltransferase domain-containing protein n=1 Tax=Pyricularia grisea TaxID=148305 RepID=A0ABQ8NFY1_PYRGI|nr:hypothetical protein MCOR01_001042 [Pyricularia oryzae]KAI6295986.1 hypothetical protein MCOR33_007283 [Pyricularia grisea]KAH9430440.1 hypothetical protein MCOR02_010143 [Pyricularia oryzae]KAI6255156.1 hypothetical protein MCOR19_008366 [Pyricularia oryzae]KAI6271016.1 hypothetical protein MCOR26_007971 [Pyricularia oryzae]